MWPLQLVDLFIPIAIQVFDKFMKHNSDKHLKEYIEKLEYRTQTLEKKVRALQIFLLTTITLEVVGFIIFGTLYFF